jgi:hypothetical protein
MRIAKLKTANRKTDGRLQTYGVMTYGENNDYPEKVKEVFNASPTGKGCLNTSIRFVFGGGFSDVALANYIINRKGQTSNTLLKKCVEDKQEHDGFALHVNYNGLYEIAEVQHIPFEHCRIGIDDDGNTNGFIAVHPDWTARNKVRRKALRKEDIKYYPVFNPIKEVIDAQLKGNPITEFTGQVFYFSNEGDLVYPLCPFDSTVTDMATEESISTVLHRNAKHNFLPAGMIIKKKKTETTNAENQDSNSPDDDGLANEITEWQGDERAAKMILVETEFDEEAPTFVPFTIQNFDRMFDSTSKYVQDTIGRMFMQPPILRGVDVGAGFGADLLKNAYDFYNSIVEGDRKTVESEMKKILTLLPVKFASYDIMPLTYLSQATNEKLDK